MSLAKKKKKQEMCIKMKHNNHIYLRMYTNIKWQISTMQKPQLLLHQPNIVQGGLACCDSWGRKELDMT